MKNQRNREHIQCPSCGAWNMSNASMCESCGRVLQIREKPPVDYRRLMPVIVLAVGAVLAFSFWGYLKFTVSDAQRKIANQEYEAAANELMRISFYKEADELLDAPGVEDVEAVRYSRAKKMYKAGDTVGAMEKLVSIQMYEDSEAILEEYLRNYLNGDWKEMEEGEERLYFGYDNDEFYLEIYDSEDETNNYQSEYAPIDNIIFGTDENGNLDIGFYATYENEDYYLECSNIQEDTVTIGDTQFMRW